MSRESDNNGDNEYFRPARPRDTTSVKVDRLLVGLAFAAIIGLSSYSMKEIVELKVTVGKMAERIIALERAVKFSP